MKCYSDESRQKIVMSGKNLNQLMQTEVNVELNGLLQSKKIFKKFLIPLII